MVDEGAMEWDFLCEKLLQIVGLRRPSHCVIVVQSDNVDQVTAATMDV